jgi:hypothetical protein
LKELWLLQEKPINLCGQHISHCLGKNSYVS